MSLVRIPGQPSDVLTGPVSRRDLVKTAGFATGLAAAGLGIEGILAGRKAPAYAPGTSIHFLL
jgi:hypothetical protein